MEKYHIYEISNIEMGSKMTPRHSEGVYVKSVSDVTFTSLWKSSSVTQDLLTRKLCLVAIRFVYAKLSSGASRVRKTSAPITRYSMTPVSRAKRVVHRIFSLLTPPPLQG